MCNFIKTYWYRLTNKLVYNNLFRVFIAKIFNTKNYKFNYLDNGSGIVSYKINKIKFGTDKNNTKKTVEINKRFTESFNQDLRNTFFKMLEKKHQLETNFQPLNELISENIR